MIAKVYWGRDPIEFTAPDSKLTRKQEKTIVAPYDSGVFPRSIHRLCLSYDDSCGNGHNTFNITIETKTKETARGEVMWSGGCDHESVAENFPEYAHLIPYHGCSSFGPTHYLSDAMYTVGNRDYNDQLKGDVSRYDTEIQFADFPIRQPTTKYLLKFLEDHKTLKDFEHVSVVEVKRKERREDNGYKYSNNFVFWGMEEEWYKSVANDKVTADRLLDAFKKLPYSIVKTPTAYSEGKERDLAGARKIAIWPDAEVEDFTIDELMGRLPTLLETFKGKMEGLGFEY